MQKRLILAFLLGVWLPINAVHDHPRELDSYFRIAEKAMLHHDFETAQKRFQEILQLGALDLCTPDQYASLLVRLATAEQNLGNLDEAKKLLAELDMSRLTAGRIVESQVLLARLHNRLDDADLAVTILCNLDKVVSRKRWKREDRAFFTGVLLCISDRYRTLLQRAERCLDGGLYAEAAPLYQQVLEAILEGHLPVGSSKKETVANLRLRLGESAYQQEHYAQATQWLLPLREEAQGFSPAAESTQPLYILGLAQMKLKEHEEALETFRLYLQLSPPTAPQRGEVVWQSACSLFHLGRLERARELFGEVTGSPGLKQRAEIYLSRIDLQVGNPALAEERLAGLLQSAEVSYLRGEAAFRLREFEDAALHFQRAIPQGNSHALYGFGRSLLRLKLYAEAERAFLKLIEMTGSDRAFLGLARTYIAQNQTETASTLLARQFHTVEGEAEALLLLAGAKPSYSLRAQVYRQLLTETYRTTAAYRTGWLRWGIDQFQLDMSEASETLETAYELLKESRPESAALALKLRAKAFYNQGRLEKAFELFEMLINGPLFASIGEKGEIYYLCGLAGSHANGGAYLQRVASGPYAAPSLYALGTLAYDAEDYASAEAYFVRLSSALPNSSLAGDAWFFAAMSAELAEKNYSTIATYRRHVFEDYPRSKHAAESYFSLYAFADYLYGDSAALLHLREMPKLYPDSSFSVIACYLLGLKEREAGWFAKAREIYRTVAIPEENRAYVSSVYQRALLELARGELAREGDLRLAREALEEATQSEEAQFLLAKVYLAEGDSTGADRFLVGLCSRGQENHIAARSWKTRGEIAVTRGKFETALSYFEAVDEPLLTTDQLLELWIQKSICYRELGEFDRAMLLLSKVINSETISPHRVEAMYLRASVYDLQGRRELAIRQLEATAKKGGEWAEQAQVKLQGEYGL